MPYVINRGLQEPTYKAGDLFLHTSTGFEFRMVSLRDWDGNWYIAFVKRGTGDSLFPPDTPYSYFRVDDPQCVTVADLRRILKTEFDRFQFKQED